MMKVIAIALIALLGVATVTASSDSLLVGQFNAFKAKFGMYYVSY
jgi:hypothetical protein